ncbi:MAG TPA: LysM peptidoglycan-binding domain-containing protein [Anaerolineaceae bacterium]|nr:LysM peptidoglycan-binding domain-containing protein [Anaerolineaceae bacterium]
MKKNLYFILAAVLLIGLLTACELPASRAPDSQSSAATPTSEIAMPTPKETEDTIGMILTMTAVYNQTPVAPATPTPQADLNTPQPQVATPTPVIVQPGTSWAPTPGLPSTYALQKGEFPYCIARRFNLDIAAFQNLNPGVNFANTYFDPGLSLKIPQNTTWSSGPRALKAHPTTYTVQSGDTIFIVGCKFGDVDPNGLIVVNGLQSPYTLTAGQTIKIP